MKECQVCHAECDDKAETCPACGEASWPVAPVSSTTDARDTTTGEDMATSEIRQEQKILTGTSKTSAGTTVIATVQGLAKYDDLRIDAVLAGGTGGVLDLYLQRKLATDVWLDWLRFTQIAAGAAKYYSLPTLVGSNTITEVGLWADAGTGTQVLATNTCVGGHPGDQLRLVGVAGSGTSAGGAQTIYITGLLRYT